MIRYFNLIIIVFSTLNCIGQEIKFNSSGKFRDTIINKGNVTTRDIIYFKDSTTYTFHDNDSTSIIFSKNDFISILKKEIMDNNVDWKQKLLVLMLSESDSIINFRLNFSPIYFHSAKSIVANLMESGNCYIKYIYSTKTITKLNIIEFVKDNNHGRKFCTDDKTIVMEIWYGAL